MKLSDHDLRQMDSDWVDALPAARLRKALRQTLQDLKEARDRLNMTPANSSRPPGSMAPWEGSASSPQESLASGDNAGASSATVESNTQASDQVTPPEGGAEAKRVAGSSGKSAGKQSGAPGYGRIQQFPANATCPHYPAACAACAAVLPQDGAMRTWTAWDQVDIVPLSAGQFGLKLCCTRHLLYEAVCDCGHVTRAMPYRAPDDGQWDRTGLCEWRLVGPFLASMIVILSLRMRLISHGTRSPDGTRAFTLLTSVIETCRLRKASPWRYLATVIDATRKGVAPPSLPTIQNLAAGV